MKIPINEIFIGDRQRIDIGDPMTDLASIGDPEVGLINPITVEATTVVVGDHMEKMSWPYKLIAGRRRLEWHIRTGKTEIEATVLGGLSELQRQKIELLEDIERKDRTWQEECLAFYNLYSLIRREKAQANQSWTERAMAKFTKMSNANMHYSLEIGRMLAATPKDETLWECSNFTEALKTIVERNYKAANDELEVRRKLWQEKEQAAREVTEESPSQDFIEALEPAPEAAPEGDAQELSDTPRKTKVFIHGLNMSFEDAKPGVHFMEGMSRVILAYKAGGALDKNVHHALHTSGTVMAWSCEGLLFIDEDMNIIGQNYPIVWNKIALGVEEIVHPFYPNYELGYVMYGENRTEPNPNPSGSVISAMPDGDDLPYAVVEWCLKAICDDKTPVLLPCNAPVLAVAMTGRTPIWFEADPAKFAEKVQALKNYYLDTVPNAEIYLRKVDSTGDWSSELI